MIEAIALGGILLISLSIAAFFAALILFVLSEYVSHQ